MEYVKLNTLCTFKQWPTIKLSEMIDDGLYNVYGANGIIGKSNKFNHEKPTLLITCRGATCGTLNISSGKCYITGNAMCLDDLSDQILLTFLFYYLSYIDKSFLITGTAQPQITIKSLNNLEVPLIPSNQQQKIATHLDKITESINNKKKQLALFDELVKSKFVEMFGDLEANPKKWNVVNFDYAAKIDGVMTTDYEKYADCPHIGIDSIMKNTGELVGYRTVKEDNVISGKYLFTPEHIIYSKIRPNLNKVALPDFSGLCSADSYPILVNSKNCNRYYFAYVLRSDFFLSYILAFSSRAGMPKVNREQIRGFKFPLPPLPLQNQFADFVQKCDRAKSAVKQEITCLQELLDSKMQEYFGNV